MLRNYCNLVNFVFEGQRLIEAKKRKQKHRHGRYDNKEWVVREQAGVGSFGENETITGSEHLWRVRGEFRSEGGTLECTLETKRQYLYIIIYFKFPLRWGTTRPRIPTQRIQTTRTDTFQIGHPGYKTPILVHGGSEIFILWITHTLHAIQFLSSCESSLWVTSGQTKPSAVLIACFV